jgi:DNA-binding SARP family transcriptional activator
MSSIKVSLFGKFNIDNGEKKTYIRARKVQELLIYLLVFREHPQPRESLSEILWTDQPALISKKNLRQTLWHLQSTIKDYDELCGFELLIEDGWIHIRLPTNFWLDTAEFEQVFAKVNHKNAKDLSAEDFEAMESAVRLYKGDLLEGWYQDWCIFERERFQMMNLALLDKLVQYCEIHRQYDAGLSYGWQILRHDHAYERAHRQLMRLYSMSGDRTQALHQYQRCIDALSTELGVEPSERTRQLYTHIQSDTFVPTIYASEKVESENNQSPPTFKDMLIRLELLSGTLRRMENHVAQEISALRNMIEEHDKQSSK